MAKSKNTEATESEEGGSLRSHMYKHEAMVQWLEEQGHAVSNATPAEVIAIAFAKRVEWRKSDTYRSLVEGRSEQLASEKAARQQEREQAREARKAEKAAARAAKKSEPKEKAAPAKAVKATKAAKGKSGKGKASSAEENPFD